jgi:hypothetical protein
MRQLTPYEEKRRQEWWWPERPGAALEDFQLSRMTTREILEHFGYEAGHGPWEHWQKQDSSEAETEVARLPQPPTHWWPTLSSPVPACGRLVKWKASDSYTLHGVTCFGCRLAARRAA